MSCRTGLVLALLVAAVAPQLVWASELEVDPKTGFVVAPGFELVQANCTACHSSGLTLQMRADRDGWLELIRWMQRTQNLWQFPPATEAEIVNYLATHYAPTHTRFRRRPLDPSLLPRLE